MRGAQRQLLYLAVPPSLIETIVEGIADVGLNQHSRILVEKLFGRDLASARGLNRCLLRRFAEDAVFPHGSLSG